MTSDNELIDDIIANEKEFKEAFSEPIESRELYALALQYLGVKSSCSTGIHDFITRGYGLLDENGFFQYPLPDGPHVDDLRDQYNAEPVVIMRYAVLMEDEGKDKYIKICPRPEALDWISAQETQYFKPNDYYLMERLSQ